MTSRHSLKTVILLAVCQALFLSSTSAVITSIALVGKELATYGGFATWPIACQFGSMMGTTYFASMYMKRFGRRVGFVTGALLGIMGALVATHAVFNQNFWLFCAGAALIGSFNAFSHYFRFAAADAADVAYRSRAISLVLAGGIVAAVVGPNLANLSVDLFAPVRYAGVFSVIIFLYVAIITIMAFIDIPKPSEAERSATGRPLGQIARQPKYAVAVMAGVFGYLVMSFLMTVTPVAMVDQCGYTFGDSAIVIQGHIIGMYLPSFFTGYLIARYGVTNIMAAGALLQLLCILVNVSGIDVWNFRIALFLVGAGWNFLFIGGTTLLTECYVPAEKAKAQGLNDLCIWGMVTMGALVSGTLVQEVGWVMVNYAVSPLVLVMLAAVMWLKFSGHEKTAPVAAE